MKCNKCGLEFGKGETCQHCGADKVSALGEFSGYSTPKANSANTTKAKSPASIPRIEPTSSQLCWKCGEIIPHGNFCPVCGQELFRVCPKCNAKYSSQYHICPNCGTNHLDYEKAQALERERKRAYETEQARIRERQRIQAEKEAAEQKKRERQFEQENNIRKKLERFKENATQADTSIHQYDWPTHEQKETAIALLAKLNAEIEVISKKGIQCHTSLSDIQKAWEALEGSEAYQGILAEKKREEEEEFGRQYEELLRRKEQEKKKEARRKAFFVRMVFFTILNLFILVGYTNVNNVNIDGGLGIMGSIVVAYIISKIIDVIKYPKNI